MIVYISPVSAGMFFSLNEKVFGLVSFRCLINDKRIIWDWEYCDTRL